MNGLVYRINDRVYLSLYDTEGQITDGIMIEEGMYKNLNKDEISFIDVVAKDGTLELEVNNVHDFIRKAAETQSHDIFYSIKNVMVYEYKQMNDAIKKGNFPYIAKYIYNAEKYKRTTQN